jgi:hypothetical protein
MATTGMLVITDGTTSISLLGEPGPFHLTRWKPRIAQPKGGGTWQQSSLSDGRRLVDKRYNNVIESFTLEVKGLDADVLARDVQELRRLLEKGSQYFSTDWQTAPVYLSARADSETNTRHAVIHSWSTPEDEDPYGLTFEKADDGTLMASWTLLVERSHWTENVPGTGTCAQASGTGVSEWPYYLEFDAEAVDIDCGNNAAINDLHDAAMTAEAWVRSPLDATNEAWGESDAGRIADKSDYDGAGAISDGWTLGVRKNIGVEAYIACATADAFSHSGTDDFDLDGEWHHIAMTWDDATFQYPKLWIDGTEVSYLATQNRNGVIQSDAAITLGLGCQNTSALVFEGDIGWLRISDSVRYTVGFTPPVRCTLPDIDANTVGLWIYEGQGTTAHNLEGTTALDGTITNESWDGDCTAVTFGQEATCDDEAYVANKENRAQLTHIYSEAGGGGFTGNLITTTPTYDLWDGVIANDAIYFGVATVKDFGPFCSLVFDIDTVATYTATSHAHWQFWDSTAGPGWSDLTVVDNTATAADLPFTVAGVASVQWEHDTNWVTNAINGVVAYWVRCIVHIPAGAVTTPDIQNRQPYTVTWPYVEIAAAQVGGDLAALAQKFLTNWSYDIGSGATGRVIAGLRSTSRGSDFQAYLNCAPDDPNDQNPGGVDVSYFNSTTSGADVTATTGYAATCTFVQENMLTRVRFDLDSTVASDFYGRFHAYVRCEQSGGAAGDLTVRVGTSIGTTYLPRYGRTVATPATAAWTLLDCGTIAFPPVLDPLLGESYAGSFHIQAARSTGAGQLIFYDLVLVPADEWIGDFLDSENTGDATSLLLNDELKTTSLSFPRVPHRAIVWDNATGLFRAYWQSIMASPFILQANAAQRLYFVSASAQPTYFISEPWFTHSVQLFCNQRYFSYRGAR